MAIKTIQERIVVAVEAKESEPGLRWRMRANKNGFTEELEIDFVHLESYTKTGEVLESVRVSVVDLLTVAKTTKEMATKPKGRVLVKATMVK